MELLVIYPARPCLKRFGQTQGGYNGSTMSEGFHPTQIIALCGVFVVFHLIALPPFLWAMSRGQFRGKEQWEWTLDDAEAPDAIPAMTPMTPRRARWMLAVLATLGMLTLSSIVLTLVFAMSAPAHPAVGKCPF